MSLRDIIVEEAIRRRDADFVEKIVKLGPHYTRLAVSKLVELYKKGEISSDDAVTLANRLGENALREIIGRVVERDVDVVVRAISDRKVPSPILVETIIAKNVRISKKTLSELVEQLINMNDYESLTKLLQHYSQELDGITICGIVDVMYKGMELSQRDDFEKLRPGIAAIANRLVGLISSGRGRGNLASCIITLISWLFVVREKDTVKKLVVAVSKLKPKPEAVSQHASELLRRVKPLLGDSVEARVLNALLSFIAGSHPKDLKDDEIEQLKFYVEGTEYEKYVQQLMEISRKRKEITSRHDRRHLWYMAGIVFAAMVSTLLIAREGGLPLPQLVAIILVYVVVMVASMLIVRDVARLIEMGLEELCKLVAVSEGKGSAKKRG